MSRCSKLSTYHAGLKLGDTVPVFDTNSYAVSFEEGQRIISELKKQKIIKAFLLRGHGLVAMGRNISDAVNTAELIEETAMIAILVQFCGFRKKSY
jgi:ribulose-5-phosphate 4-epimerase/fuculose-1-phosphate aldolase